jgi:hypothetical protein
MIDQGGGGAASLNLNTEEYIAYCFHSVEGYSRVGSYTATGTAADIEFNNFIYLGFRPKWIMIKNSNATGGGGSGNWCIVDTERDTYNPVNKRLEADSGDVENADGRTGAKLDFCSNGFKILGTAGDGKYEWNWTGQNYIYLAFAETPFKYANAR